jgi:hypothetical protein
MEIPSIPESDQIGAMLDGSVYKLISDYIPNPSQYNLKQYLTISRRTLVRFLTENTGKAQAYFEEHTMTSPLHDVEQIWKEGSKYFVATMDHGKPRFVRQFATLAEAVAEHLLVTYGMY